MNKPPKQKPYWEMTTEELAEATKEFDDPNYDPPAVKPTKKQAAQLRRWQQRRKRAQVTLVLDTKLIEQTDDYAVSHRRTFSDVVSDALRQLMGKRTARRSRDNLVRKTKQARLFRVGPVSGFK